MSGNTRAALLRRTGVLARAFVLFAPAWAWVRFVVDPSLFYHGYWISGDFPRFALDAQFVRPFFGRPGGPLECLTALLCQLYYWPWVGAFVVTAAVALLCCGTRWLLRADGPGGQHVAYVAPGVLALALFCRYGNGLGMVLALGAAVWAAGLYARIPSRNGLTRVVLFVALGVALWYLAGRQALLYAALCGMYELARGRRLVGAALLAPVAAAALAALPEVVRAGLVARLSAVRVSFRSDPVLSELVLMLELCVPAAALVAWRAGRDRGQGRSGFGRFAFNTAFVLAAAAAALVPARDTGYGALLRLQRASQARRWEEVLRQARRLPPALYKPEIMWEVNRALWHTGRMASDMFDYRQSCLGLLPSGTVLERMRPATLGYMRYSDLLMDLGRVNESAHLAYEALETLGPRPAVLRRLALAAVIKGRKALARRFLLTLRKDLVHRREAGRLLERLRSDAGLCDDPVVRRARRLMLKKDGVTRWGHERMLKELLAANARNRMAFEYLMAYYLLNGRLASFARELPRIRALGYRELPAPYEQALLLYEELTGRAVNVPGYGISKEAREQFVRFRQDLQRYGAGPGRQLLRQRYRGTYLLYYSVQQAKGWG